MGYKLKEENLESRTSTLITIRRCEYEELLQSKKELARMMDVEKENELLSRNMEDLMLLKDMRDITFVDGMVVDANQAKSSQGKSQGTGLWNKWVAGWKKLFSAK